MKTKNTRGLLTAVICFSVFFIGTYAQYQVSPLAVQIMEELQIDSSQYALMFTFCMFPALFLSVVSGVLSDKFGVKRTMAVALALSTAGIVGRVFVSGYTAMLGCMLVLGLGCMFMTATSAKVLAAHFAPAQLGSVMGPVSSGSTVAMFVALATTAWFPSTKAAYIFSAVLAVAVLAAWIMVIKDPAPAAEQPQGASIKDSLIACLKSKHLWLNGLTLLFLMTPQVIISSFLPQALQVEKGMDGVTAGYMTSIYMLGAIAGSIFGPGLFAKCKVKRVFTTVLTVYVAVSAAFGWNIGNPIVLAIIMGLCGFAISTFVPLLYALPISLPEIGPVYAGTAGGFSATIQMLGATLVPTSILTPMFGHDFGTLFLSAGVVAAISILTVNLLPLYKKH